MKRFIKIMVVVLGSITSVLLVQMLLIQLYRLWSRESYIEIYSTENLKPWEEK